MSEQQIVNGILDYLALHKIKAIHHKTIGHIIHKDGQKIFGQSTRRDQKGAPDIIFSYWGQPVALEVKSETGRVSPEQLQWSIDFSSPPNMGRYFVVRSIDDVELALSKIKK